jgi:predicted transposase/invertase (TIGR01784 family)
MRNYLDPKHDLLFKCIFGKHPDLLKSLLNALLPLKEKQYITDIEYFPDEYKKDVSEKENLDVTAFCVDNLEEKFIVTTQMYRNTSFKKQMLYNVTKNYVRQEELNENYLLFPIYGLGFINDIFDNKKERYYHYYCLSNSFNYASDEGLSDMKFVMIELPKFTAANTNNPKAALWLRFLKEVGEDKNLPSDLLDYDDIRQAIELCDVNKFTEEEIDNYNKYQEIVHTKKTAPDTE